jgi:hypothetical protein
LKLYLWIAILKNMRIRFSKEEVSSTEGPTLIWEYRLALWMPRPTIVGVVLISGFLTSAYFCFLWLIDRNAHLIAVLIAVLIGYSIMASRYVIQSEALDWQKYAPVSLGRDRYPTKIAAFELRRDQVRRSRVAGLAGVLVVFTVNEVGALLEGLEPHELIGSLLSVHEGTAILPLTLLLGWILGRAVYLSRASNRELPLPDPPDVDLLQLSNLYAIGRSGLRRAFVGLLGVSIGGLIFTETEFGLWATVPVFLLGLTVGLSSVLKPARRVRALIGAAKTDQLARLEPRLIKARDQMLAGDISSQGRLTDLMTYRDSVLATPQWSFDTPTVTRFSLYLLIPVGSMIGGVFVERIVDALLT